MSFFDEVETTVANSRFIQARGDGDPVELDLRPIDELQELKKELTESNKDIEEFLKSKTFGEYLFTKFLKVHHGHREACEWLNEVKTEFRTASEDVRASKGKSIYEKYFTPKPPKVETPEEEERPELSDPVTHKAPLIEAGKEELELPPECDVSICLLNWLQEKRPGVVENLKKQVDCGSYGLFDETEKAVVELWQEEDVLGKFKLSPLWDTYVQLMDYKTKKVCAENFRVFRPLGRGAFGMVSAVQKSDTRAIFAMKEMSKKQVKANESETMCVTEKHVLSIMDQPFVLQLKYSFHDKANLYLVFDMCNGGDLKFHLREDNKRTPFAPERAKFYAAEILLGLEHMHSFDIVYRDMKPHNLLLNSDGHVIISDLGLSIKIREDKPCRHLAGTAGYWAPEVLSKKGTFKVSDYWSFAVVLYEMLMGYRPASKAKKPLEWSPFGQSTSNEENALNENGILVLDVDYTNPVFEQDKTVVDLLQKLFEPDPTKRLGANGTQEIKNHPYFKDIDFKHLERLEIPPAFVPNKDRVYAHTIGEVGAFNQSEFRKVKITPEDDQYYADWDFISERGIQAELAQALYKIDHPPLPKQTPAVNNSSCCAIL